MPPMEDRISPLPDPVLCHILSFLPTQEAVATSLLSKRWRPLWLSAPSLHLHDESFLENGTKTYSSFFKFVYAAILARSLHYRPLKTFTLLSPGSCRQHEQEISYSHLMIWVNAVIQRGIEHLNIGLGSRLELPCNILSCRTLVVLKLTCLLLSTCSPVDLPALKTLSLNRLRMLHARYLAELLHGCPILENFEAKELIVRNESTAVEFKSLSKLKSVEISGFSGVDIPWKAICNVEFLCFSQEIDSQIDEDYIPVFHNLIHLDLKFGKWPLVFEMIEHCPKLQSLVLYNLVPSKWEPEIWHSPKLVPECISSQLRKFTFSNYGGKEYELQFAKYIMQNSRALHTITIHNFHSRKYKLEMLQELAFCPRSSATCQLSFT